MMGRFALIFILTLGLGLSPAMTQDQELADRLNDYPTAARADYVFACMAANGPKPPGAGALCLLDRRNRVDLAL